MKHSNNIEAVIFSRVSDLDDLELLHATFVTHTFPKHTHETFAIGVIERGVQATFYKGATHIATAGDICLVNPGEVHTGFSPHESGWTYRVFYPDAALLQKVAKEVSTHGKCLPHFPSPVIKDPFLSSRILSLLKIIEDSDVLLEKESLLLSVLGQMIHRHAHQREDPPLAGIRKRSAVKTVLEYLDANFTENITLGELSNMADVSRFHLLRLFRATVGLPPHAYLIQKRIDYARALLSRRLPLSEIALETGFSDQSHFTRRFKDVVGVTPGRYCRKSNSVQESR